MNSLRLLRKAAGLSVTNLAKAAGTHPLAVYSYESAGRTPSLGVLRRLCKALGVPLAAFEGCELKADGRIKRRTRR